MLHKMHLKEVSFEKIKNGSKTIELRLNDEKRQQIQIGDFIEFSQLDGSDKLTVRVTALHHYSSFAELYSSLPKEKLGYAASEMPDPDHMDEYYPREKQEQYGVSASNYTAPTFRSLLMHRIVATALVKHIRQLYRK